MNDDIADQLKRWISIQRYGSGLKNKANEQIDSLFADIVSRSARPNVLLRNIRANLLALKDKQVIDLIDDLVSMSSLIAESENKRIVKDLGEEVSIQKVSKAETKKLYTGATVTTAGSSPSKALNRAYTVATGGLRINLLRLTEKKMNKEQFLEQVSGIQDELKRNVGTSIRTVTNKTANYAYEKQYKNTSINRVMWISVLDHRTSPFCQAADTKVFKLNHGPRPPAHLNCRSTVIVIDKEETIEQVKRDLLPRAAVVSRSDKALSEKGLTTRTGKKRTASRNPKRSPLKGTTVRNTSYETWLRSQSKLYQQKVLGVKSADKFRSGTQLSKVLEDKHSALDFSSLNEALN